jgi:hypothetical protein
VRRKKKVPSEKSDFIRSARFFCKVAGDEMNVNWCVGASDTEVTSLCLDQILARPSTSSTGPILVRSLDMNHEVLSRYVLAIVVSHTTIKREIQLFYGADFVSGGLFENGET